MRKEKRAELRGRIVTGKLILRIKFDTTRNRTRTGGKTQLSIRGKDFNKNQVQVPELHESCVKKTNEEPLRTCPTPFLQ